jgi:hypothetical protein
MSRADRCRANVDRDCAGIIPDPAIPDRCSPQINSEAIGFGFPPRPAQVSHRTLTTRLTAGR